MVSRGSVAGARFFALAASAILLFVGNAILAVQPAFAQSAAAPGPEVCANCHEAQVNYYKSSVHGQK